MPRARHLDDEVFRLTPLALSAVAVEPGRQVATDLQHQQDQSETPGKQRLERARL